MSLAEIVNWLCAFVVTTLGAFIVPASKHHVYPGICVYVVFWAIATVMAWLNVVNIHYHIFK